MVIVDDERIIRDTLKNTFKWDEFGITEVYEAPDGEDALKIIKNKKPDIILTDIKMPVIDGLKLSSTVKEQFKNAVIIVLSGFDEFNLVREALNIGVFDYLLKPVREEELKKVIGKAVELVRENMEKEIEQRTISQRIVEGNLAIKDRFLNTLILNNYREDDLTYCKLKDLGVKIEFRNYFVSIFRLDSDCRENCIKKGFDMQLLMFSVNNIIDECCSRITGNYELFITAENDSVLVMEGLEHNSDVFLKLMSEIREGIKIFLEADVVIGVSVNYYHASSIKASYDQARELVEKKLYFGCDVMTISPEREEDLLSLFFKEREKTFVNSIYSCDNEKANSIIEEIFDQVLKIQLPLKQVKMLNVSIVKCILGVLDEIGYEADGLAGNSKNIYEKVDALKSIESFIAFAKDVIYKAVEAVKRRNAVRKKKLIDGILKYIDEHFYEELTLSSLSEKFYINYTNLSKMFKEDVGKLFSKYLVDLRISRAKEMLKGSGMKIYEISEAVGYTDVRYFTKLFKDLEGVTPQEYRRNIGIMDTD